MTSNTPSGMNSIIKVHSCKTTKSVSNATFSPIQNPSMYNEFQIEAIQSVVEAVQDSYALPRICLPQGPPGTGKTRTISGLIRAIFQVRDYLSSSNLGQPSNNCMIWNRCLFWSFQSLPPQQSKGPALPGQQLRQVQQARKPHILVCAPSNGGVDEIARRLIKEGQVTGIPQCKEKHGSTTTRGYLHVLEVSNRWTGIWNGIVEWTNGMDMCNLK